MSDDHETLPDEPVEQPTEVGDSAGASLGSGAPEPVVPVCAECATPLEEGQAYCLECGAPTPAAPGLRRRLGPAGILALGLVVLGVGAGTLAYALARDDDDVATVPTTVPTGLTALPSVGTTFPTDPTASVDVTDFTTATGLPPVFTGTGTTIIPPPSTDTTDPGLTGTGTDPGLTGTTPSTQTDTQTEPTTTEPPAASGADTWPDGTNGWTVILASTSSQSDAARFRDRVRASGRAAGLIDSSLYTTLEPNLWVVFVGQYSSRTQAISQAASLRSTYPGAYAQRIES
jgi:cell division septation protein DedD